MTASHRLYDPVHDLRGDDGENAAIASVVAVLDPGLNYPDCGRIIVGAPEASDAAIGGFSGGPEAIMRLADTLALAAADVDDVLDAETPPIIQAGGDGRCEVCCREIFPGQFIQRFEDGRVVVHAFRCTPQSVER